METKVWHFPKRSGHIPGPWDDEPDKIQWEDQSTGMLCLAVRGHDGAWRGYVGIEPGHPFYGVKYDSCTMHTRVCREKYCVHAPDNLLHAYGGLTYSGYSHEDEPNGICVEFAPGDRSDIWWFGFDCCHLWDLVPALTGFINQNGAKYRTLSFVQEKCQLLAWQLQYYRHPKELKA